MDVLSEVLRAVHLTGAMYFEVDASHPWISVNPSMDKIGSAMMPNAEHVIPFHVMVSGHAWAMPEDRSVRPMQIEAGDIVIFPYGQSHIVTSDCDSWEGPPVDLDFYYGVAAEKETPFTLVNLGGTGEKAKFVCGYLGCDASPFNPLLGSLPKMLIVAAEPDSERLMHELLHAALAERTNPKAGADTILAKLSEVMFVQAMRQYMDALPADALNWFAGVRDKHIGGALRAIHAQPSRSWSLEGLAKEAGLSRSSFAERFLDYVGETPMQYLGRWRMQMAGRLLKEGLPIGKVADEVGYSSEAAFQRAFKKHVGVTPGKWRARV